MPNWHENILHIAVPEALESLIPEIISHLAASNVDADEEYGQWLDFNRLLPAPTEMKSLSEDSGGNAWDIKSIMSGKWPEHLTPPKDIGEPGEEKSMAWLKTVDTKLHDNVCVAIKIAKDYGTHDLITWRTTKWGTKWNAEKCDHPEIIDADDFSHYDEFAGCKLIKYRFTTAWCSPIAYVAVLAQQCNDIGLGMCFHDSGSDDGSRWDPATEEYITIWYRQSDMNVEPREMTHTEIVLTKAKKALFHVDANAETPAEEPIWMKVMNNQI